MKKLVLMCMLLTLTAAPAFAQIESIGIYEDQTALDCEIADSGPVKIVYIVHTNSTGAQASQWKLFHGSGMNMTFLSGVEFPPFLKIGSAQGGATIAYTECKVGTFPVMTLQYLATGASTPCSQITLVADDSVTPPTLAIVDCAFNLEPFPPGTGIVNATTGCLCDVATEQKTWGSIKALYR